MNFWQFKFKDELWSDFKSLKVGDTFNSTIGNHKNKMANRIDDIVFWYRMDGKRSLYFVSKILSDTQVNNKGKFIIKMSILKTLIDKPFSMVENGFGDLVEKINKKGKASSRYLFEDEDRGDELYKILMG